MFKMLDGRKCDLLVQFLSLTSWLLISSYCVWIYTFKNRANLSKRPSNNSLIHFYKRCVSMALRFSIDQSYLFRIKEGPLNS